jgi:hypothetical protein
MQVARNQTAYLRPANTVLQADDHLGRFAPSVARR